MNSDIYTEPPHLFVPSPIFLPINLYCCVIGDPLARYLAIFLSTFDQKAFSGVLDDITAK